MLNADIVDARHNIVASGTAIAVDIDRWIVLACLGDHYFLGYRACSAIGKIIGERQLIAHGLCGAVSSHADAHIAHRTLVK